MKPALRIVPTEPKRRKAVKRKWTLRHVPQHLDERTYPSGHVWRIYRAHVEMVLRARARVCFGEKIR